MLTTHRKGIKKSTLVTLHFFNKSPILSPFVTELITILSTYEPKYIPASADIGDATWLQNFIAKISSTPSSSSNTLHINTASTNKIAWQNFKTKLRILTIYQRTTRQLPLIENITFFNICLSLQIVWVLSLNLCFLFMCNDAPSIIIAPVD